jgi:hypothetical protein
MKGRRRDTRSITGSRPSNAFGPDRRSRGIRPDLPTGKGAGSDPTGQKIAECMDAIKTVITLFSPQANRGALRDLMTIGTAVGELIEDRDQWKPDQNRLIDLASDQVTPLCKSGDELVDLVEHLKGEQDEVCKRAAQEREAQLSRYQQQSEVAAKNHDELRAALVEAQAAADALRKDRDKWRAAGDQALKRGSQIADDLRHERDLARKERDEARTVALRLADDLDDGHENSRPAALLLADAIADERTGAVAPFTNWPKRGDHVDRC